jgi:hypothetical protein
MASITAASNLPYPPIFNISCRDKTTTIIFI